MQEICELRSQLENPDYWFGVGLLYAVCLLNAAGMDAEELMIRLISFGLGEELAIEVIEAIACRCEILY